MRHIASKGNPDSNERQTVSTAKFIENHCDSTVVKKDEGGKDEGKNYMCLYTKYKRHCVDLLNANKKLQAEIACANQQCEKSNIKKEKLKDLIRKMDAKLKQKTHIVTDLEGKLLSVSNENSNNQYQVEELRTMRTKMNELETKLNVRIKNLYRSVRTIITDNTNNTNNDIQIRQNVENDDPIKIISAIEKMISYIDVRVFKKWKEQIIALIRSVKPSDCVITDDCDENTELLQIINCIKTHIDKRYIETNLGRCGKQCKLYDKYDKCDKCDKCDDSDDTCSSSSESVFDSDLLKRIFDRLGELGNTIGSSELIEIIKSDKKFNQELLNSCIGKYEELAHKALDHAQCDNSHLIKIIEDKNTNDAKLVDKMFEEYQTLVCKLETCICNNNSSDTSDASIDTTDEKLTLNELEELVKTCTSKKGSIEKKILHIIKCHKCDIHCADSSSSSSSNTDSNTECECECECCIAMNQNTSTSTSSSDECIQECVTECVQECVTDTHSHSDTCSDGSSACCVTIKKCPSYSCECKVHKKYRSILKHLKCCQKKNINLMIKVKCLEQNVKDLTCNKIILSFGHKCDEIKDIDATFEFLPEYKIYFDCYGYPKCLDDYLKVDIEQIKMIKKELAKKEIVKDNDQNKHHIKKITTKRSY
jgi:hypothetical protein